MKNRQKEYAEILSIAGELEQELAHSEKNYGGGIKHAAILVKESLNYRKSRLETRVWDVDYLVQKYFDDDKRPEYAEITDMVVALKNKILEFWARRKAQ
jgi:hypothetical protein